MRVMQARTDEAQIVLSVVVPALNAATTLEFGLASLVEASTVLGRYEAIVVDGGSTDGTPACAQRSGARILEAAGGRGRQLAAGAAAARGDWLLFLHADTWLERGWATEAARFIGDLANDGRAAVFRFALDDRGAAARRTERLVAWRCQALALPYGDQGLLLSRDTYRHVGGFRPLPLMEDVDLVRRIGRKRLALLDARAITSAERFRRAGYLVRSARNLSCLTLYFLGVPPHLIRRLYG